MFNFKRQFRVTLAQVLSQYRAARIELHDRGMTLRHSSPPVKGRYVTVLGDLPPKDTAYIPIPGD